MEETQRLNRSVKDLSSNGGVLMDTMKDIEVVAAGTFASITDWTKRSMPTRESRQDEMPLSKHSEGSSQGDADADRSQPSQGSKTQGNTVLQDLTWPLSFLALDNDEDGPREGFAPQFRRMREAVSKAVSKDLNTAATDIWRFAAGSRDDDDQSVGSIDSLLEETDQIRRLGSWGTINTVGTGGTSGTNDTDLDIGFGLEDDDGNIIDPVLLEKAQRHREKRSNRREKLVKFDYPPIKSLRQCPRHDPELLPDLFFTEGELDQIEDDRYSTMSTDDIEIVAVSSSGPSEPPQPKSKISKAKRGAAFDDAVDNHLANTRDQPTETGWKNPKGRTSTPYRRRRDEDDEEADFPTGKSKSPSNGRLVKGVQIYLRERSTGA
eukprot:Nitzschia sp. Nitz4//scaffold6_size259037//57022//58155//NITZ4_001053-RA/size259037-processed-gene-0.60-mRNA-1//-1//CDS//3329556830//2044//frame0